jgi:hypothetical protein
MSLLMPADVPVEITVVESDACHFCADAHRALAELSGQFPMTVESLNVRGEPGRALMARHRAPMSPLVLLDGRFFSSGRLPRRKLEKTLSSRYAAAGAAVVRQVPHG